MLRVRLFSIYAGPLGTFGPGEVAELPKVEAERLIKAGFAEAA